MNAKELATEQAKLKCRSQCIEPKWHVYLAETTWKTGDNRPLVIFECLTCGELRYLDLEAVPASLVEQAHG